MSMTNGKFRRDLPNDQFEAALNANTPSSGNPFATIADLGGGTNNIYSSDGTILSNRIVTIGTGNTLRFNIAAGSTTKFFVGRDTATPVSPIHFYAPDAAGTWIEGFNTGDQSALRVYNFGRTIIALQAQNNGNVYLSPEIGTTTRSQVAIGNGTSALASTRLYVRGGGNTDGSFILQAGNASDTKKLILTDNGQLATGSGQAALLSSSFGQIHRATNYQFGFGFYSAGGVTTAMTVQHTGNIANPVAFSAAFQGAKTGTAVAGSFSAIATGTTTQRGVDGIARNATSLVEGVRGTAGGGDSVIASQYLAGVVGSSASSVNNLQYGVYGLAQYNGGAINYTKELIAVKGIATGTTGAAGSTGAIIGGDFSTAGTAGTGDRIALRVPQTGNNGTIVFGADSVSANASLLEVTGDVETIGNTRGVIVEDRTDTNRYRIYTDGGVVHTELA
jgi:hypothetical protein